MTVTPDYYFLDGQKLVAKDNGDGTKTPQFAPASNFRDVVGRMKVSLSQNIYEADFEYSPQPLRWESLTNGGGTISHQPSFGGVRLQVGTGLTDLAVRQSRPYMRYQPGKSMYMATAVLFGAVDPSNVQRVGFFDDSNGVFFEQSVATANNPSGMYVVLRTDAGGVINETRVGLDQWSGDSPQVRNSLNWSRIQMLWIEFAWYGAGTIRWGVLLDGEPIVLHRIAVGNLVGQTIPWARTGNLPVRYEMRNTGVGALGNSMFHYGVSVLVEGRSDDQRGFTYSYGMAPATPRRAVAAATTRFPVISMRGRVMGTQEYTQASSAITAGTTTSLTATGTPWTVNQWQGRFVSFGAAGATPTVGRIVSNTTSVLTLVDALTGGALSVAPAVGNNYTIGLVNRGQLLPRRLMVSADAVCVIELIVSTPTSPVSLTGANFVPLSSLGSANSFAERDVSATALTGGEVVFAFTAPAGGSGLLDLQIDQLFPLVNTIRGNNPDILSLAVTTQSGVAANVGAHLVCQEAMS